MGDVVGDSVGLYVGPIGDIVGDRVGVIVGSYWLGQFSRKVIELLPKLPPPL